MRSSRQDRSTIDHECEQLQAEFQDVANTVQTLATKMQAAEKAGDANATEWRNDLKQVAQDIDAEQTQVKMLRLARQTERSSRMEIDKQFVLEELKKQGQSQRVQEALDQLPEKIDHERHAALLEKFGIDPGQLAEKAAREGLTKL